jgi:MerR family transcriptional regulator, light-induced transcriptional regulator
MNLQAAADTLGVHYQTAYRWVREGQLAAGKIGGSYDVEADEVDRFLSRRLIPVLPPPSLRVRDWATHIERFEVVLREGDELGAREIVDRLSDGNVPVVDICQELVAPCLRNIGQAWHAGEVSIAEEHRATAITERLLGRLANHPRGRPRGTAVVTTPPGDFHSLPSTMAALALREDRWRVHHLGVNTPIDDLAKLSVDVGADLVVVSATFGATDDLTDRVRRAIEAFGISILFGGPGTSLKSLVSQARMITSISPLP